MKKKALSLLLASAMVVSLAACGNSGSDSNQPAADSSNSSNAAADNSNSGNAAADSNNGGDAAATGDVDYHEVLGDTGLNIVVNGTVTASLDNGQAEFKQQWEEAVGIPLTIQQMDHSGYTDAVGRLFASQEYPDAMIMSADMFKQYAPTGILWDMSEAYENDDFQE